MAMSKKTLAVLQKNVEAAIVAMAPLLAKQILKNPETMEILSGIASAATKDGVKIKQTAARKAKVAKAKPAKAAKTPTLPEDLEERVAEAAAADGKVFNVTLFGGKPQNDTKAARSKYTFYETKYGTICGANGEKLEMALERLGEASAKKGKAKTATKISKAKGKAAKAKTSGGKAAFEKISGTCYLRDPKTNLVFEKRKGAMVAVGYEQKSNQKIVPLNKRTTRIAEEHGYNFDAKAKLKEEEPEEEEEEEEVAEDSDEESDDDAETELISEGESEDEEELVELVASEKEFARYQKVLNAGKVDMSDLAAVAKAAKLKKDVVEDINDNYQEYMEEEGYGAEA